MITKGHKDVYIQIDKDTGVSRMSLRIFSVFHRITIFHSSIAETRRHASDFRLLLLSRGWLVLCCSFSIGRRFKTYRFKRLNDWQIDWQEKFACKKKHAQKGLDFFYPVISKFSCWNKKGRIICTYSNKNMYLIIKTLWCMLKY